MYRPNKQPLVMITIIISSSSKIMSIIRRRPLYNHQHMQFIIQTTQHTKHSLIRMHSLASARMSEQSSHSRAYIHIVLPPFFKLILPSLININTRHVNARASSIDYMAKKQPKTSLTFSSFSHPSAGATTTCSHTTDGRNDVDQRARGRLLPLAHNNYKHKLIYLYMFTCRLHVRVYGFISVCMNMNVCVGVYI